MKNPKANRLNTADMKKWSRKTFDLLGDSAAEAAWAGRALELFVRAGMADFRSEKEEARAKVLFLALIAFYYEFWGILHQSDYRVSYYDWAESFAKSGHWISQLARQRGLRTGESDDEPDDVLAEDLESLGNDLRGVMLTGFRDLLGDSSGVFLFFYSSCGEYDRDEILNEFDPDRQAAFEFVDAEVSALPTPVRSKRPEDRLCPEHEVPLIRKPVLYGYPDPTADHSGHILGGCCFDDSSPHFGFECPIDGQVFTEDSSGKLAPVFDDEEDSDPDEGDEEDEDA